MNEKLTFYPSYQLFNMLLYVVLHFLHVVKITRKSLRKSLGSHLEKRAFDLKLTELLTILFVLISYSTNKYKLNNVVTYSSISLY